MPAYTTSVDWEIISSMGIARAKEWRDALHVESGYIKSQTEAHGEGKPLWGKDSRWQVGINFYNHTGITAFPTGYEGFDPTAVTPSRSAFYTPAVCGMLMKIGVTENYVIGQDGEALRTLVEQRSVSCLGYLKRQFQRQILAGGGSGFNQWGTLNGIDYTGTSGGVLERSAVGSQSNTIGGLSKSTYGFAIGWNNVVQDMSDAWSTNQWRFNYAIQQIKQYKDSPKLVAIMSVAAQTNLNRGVQQQVMYVNGADLDAGRTVPIYGGIKLYQDPYMPVSTATGGSSTNTYPASIYLLDTDEIRVAWLAKPAMVQGGGNTMDLPNGYFGVGKWYNIGGLQAVMGCPVMCAGQLVTSSMGSSAVIIRGQSW